MSSELLQFYAKIAGIGGLSIALVMYIFRSIIIQKNIFPKLTKAQAYNILNRIILATFIIALTGIGAWIYTYSKKVKVSNTTPPSVNSTDIINKKKLTLSGIVRSKKSNNPIEGVIIKLSSYNIESTPTDSSGHFKFMGTIETNKNRVDLNINKDHYHLFNGTFDINDNKILIELTRKG